MNGFVDWIKRNIGYVGGIAAVVAVIEVRRTLLFIKMIQCSGVCVCVCVCVYHFKMCVKEDK